MRRPFLGVVHLGYLDVVLEFAEGSLLELRVVRVRRVAVHHDDLAGRRLAAERRDDGAGLDLADEFVVVRDVRVDRALRQPVVGDDGDAGVLRLLDLRRDGLGVQRVHQDDVDLLVHHLLELPALLVLARLGVGVDDLALAVGESGDLLRDDGVVEGLEPCGVLVGQEQSHRDVVALLRRRGTVASDDSVDDAARGERERGRGRGQSRREVTHGDSTKGGSVHVRRLSSGGAEWLSGALRSGEKWLPSEEGDLALASARAGRLGHGLRDRELLLRLCDSCLRPSPSHFLDVDGVAIAGRGCGGFGDPV